MREGGRMSGGRRQIRGRKKGEERRQAPPALVVMSFMEKSGFLGKDWFGLIFFYGQSTHFRSFRTQSVTLTTLFLGKHLKQFTSA